MWITSVLYEKGTKFVYIVGVQTDSLFITKNPNAKAAQTLLKTVYSCVRYATEICISQKVTPQETENALSKRNAEGVEDSW